MRPRVRLPDALPESEVPSAPRRGRARIFGLSFAGYAAVVALCVGLTSGALSLQKTDGPEPSPASFEPTAVPAAVTSTLSEATRPETTVAQAALAPAMPSAQPTRARSTALPSCEQAAETYKDDLTEGSTALPRDMTGSAYGALLDGPATQLLLTNCAARHWRHADICVAVRGFRAVGVSVQTDPRDGSVERCIAATIAGLSFSHQPVLRLIRSEISLLPKR
ncbi:MAG: hypothetical protein JW940_33745 [Polyangiaceae bacterium]|nr:hypothetical protein [Polyangiaceae bacterium]